GHGASLQGALLSLSAGAGPGDEPVRGGSLRRAKPHRPVADAGDVWRRAGVLLRLCTNATGDRGAGGTGGTVRRKRFRIAFPFPAPSVAAAAAVIGGTTRG